MTSSATKKDNVSNEANTTLPRKPDLRALARLLPAVPAEEGSESSPDNDVSTSQETVGEKSNVLLSAHRDEKPHYTAEGGDESKSKLSPLVSSPQSLGGLSKHFSSSPADNMPHAANENDDPRPKLSPTPSSTRGFAGGTEKMTDDGKKKADQRPGLSGTTSSSKGFAALSRVFSSLPSHNQPADSNGGDDATPRLSPTSSSSRRFSRATKMLSSSAKSKDETEGGGNEAKLPVSPKASHVLAGLAKLLSALPAEEDATDENDLKSKLSLISPKSNPRGSVSLSRVVSQTVSLARRGSGDNGDIADGGNGSANSASDGDGDYGSAIVIVQRSDEDLQKGKGSSLFSKKSVNSSSKMSKRRSGKYGEEGNDELKSEISASKLAAILSSHLSLKTAPSGLVSGDRKIEEFLHEETAPGLPPIKLKEYGLDWARDVPHMVSNSIRREMMDLYIIMRSMSERKSSMNERKFKLQGGDILSFFLWIDCFVGFFEFAMLLIADDLVPWFETWKDMEEDELIEQEGGYMKVSNDLRKTIRNIQKHKQEFLNMMPEKAFTKLQRIIKKWAEVLLVYLDNIDRQGSELIGKRAEVADVTEMEARFVEKALVSKNKAVNLVLLVRFLEDRPRSVTNWKNAYLKPEERAAHPLYWKMLAKEHFEIVLYFRLSTPSLIAAKRIASNLRALPG